MINRVVLVGRLTKDIEVRKTQSGLSVTSFTVACNRRSTNGNNEADFINCTAWRQTADFLGNYAGKGMLVGVEGRITTRNYTNNAGQKVYVTEVQCDSVQLLESRSSRDQRNTNSYNDNSYSNNNYQNNGYGNQSSSFAQNDYGNNNSSNGFDDDVPSLDISSDDLPF